MKIYFAGAIRGGRDDRDLYLQMITLLQKYGEVLTEHVGDPKLSEMGEQTHETFIFNRDMSWLRDSDVIVAEVTTPSLGVGYELGLAKTLGKKILCLYRPFPQKSLSAMVRGNPAFKVEEYQTIEDAEEIIKKFFQ